ncbi:hypothetical protein N0V93_009733 [Gnomoniopsis smithogilvyi]|uniref:non-specific serine/threonine protein kinase n=1 Tax=Gnomoniopsis smithogilvyi TaxID=1191159 RepID=A0A9W8YK55_9PEZI|nr:hypothetical protein N0V93_009733 [Gnomoniopsis smithogilvyi]
MPNHDDHSDDFFPYAGREEIFEDVHNYRHRVLHPVLLGDILPRPSTCVSQPEKMPRYRIQLKIGFGAFSVVWLAFDLERKRFVSIKICQGSDDMQPTTEAAVLQHVKDNPTPGSENIIRLHDAFVIRGPNGYHNCLVTEVVVSLAELGADGRRYDDLLYSPSSVIGQLVRGFVYLHGQGIAHGDPTPSNIGIAIPQINHFTEEELLDELACELELHAIIPVKPSFPVDTVPRYLVGCTSLLDFLLRKKSFASNSSFKVKIFDFGRWSHPPHVSASLGCHLRAIKGSDWLPMEQRSQTYGLWHVSSSDFKHVANYSLSQATRLRSHFALTIANLPPELLHRISELLNATHPRSLVAFAQTSKRLYVIASRLLFRTMKITLTEGERLAKDVHSWETVLLRDKGLQHVRRLILRGIDYECEPHHNPYFSLKECERVDYDTDLESCWDLYLYDLYLYDWGGEEEFDIKENDWELLARLMKRLTGLPDLFFACPGPFPPLLLQVLHKVSSRCRLHHYTFRLSASHEASLQADERALITSPCLFTVGDLTADAADASINVASLSLARRNAPSIRRVFLYWRGPKGYEHGSRNDEDKSNRPDTPALESLQIFKHYLYHLNVDECPDSAVPSGVIDREVLHDYSALRVLKINTPIMDRTLPSPANFPCLVTLSVVCPRAPVSLAWSTHFMAFVRDLPRITTLRVLGWDRSTSFRPGLNKRLQKLHLKTRANRGGPPLLEDHVFQLAEMCPALEDLAIEINRSRGDAAEVESYRALGRLPRLQRLKLGLDATPPGIIPDDIIQIPSHVEPWFEDGWDSESPRNGLIPHRNGHVRDALVNSAIDSTLALSIVGVINSAKEENKKSDLKPRTEILPLERVEMEANNGGSFAQMTRMSGPAAKGLQSSLVLLKRRWIIERDVRDDSRNILHVREVDKDDRIKAQAQSLEPGVGKTGDDYVREVWRRVWPTADTAERLGDWWKQWESWPLDLRSVDH